MRREYSDSSFWEKLTKHAKTAGKEVVEKALILYYAAEDPETPTAAKMTIYGALAYFIFPLDTVPDYFPVAGYVDDALVLTGALMIVAFHIKPDHKKKAEEKMKDWFDTLS